MSLLTAFLAGTATGVLSAFGVGGGSLLLIYLTAFAGFSQQAAQGINLLYFLPAAAAALPAHRKNGLLDRKTILPLYIGLTQFFAKDETHPASHTETDGMRAETDSD